MKKKSLAMLVLLFLDWLLLFGVKASLNIVTFFGLAYLLPVIFFSLIVQWEIKKLNLKGVLALLLACLVFNIIANGILLLGLIDINAIIKNSSFLMNKNIALTVELESFNLKSFFNSFITIFIFEILIKFCLQKIKK